MGILRGTFDEVVCLLEPKWGETYLVDGAALCFRPLRKDRRDMFCELPSGYDTDHLGSGACKFHGGGVRDGKSPSRLDQKNSAQGRYAYNTYRHLRKHYERFALEPDMLSLIPELVLARSLMARDLELHQQGEVSSTKVMREIQQIVKIVERIEHIQSQQTLTATTVRLMMLRGLEVAKSFVPADRLEEFVLMWRNEPTAQMASMLPQSLTIVTDE